MGLTIQYSLRSTVKSVDRAHQLVEQMRQLALDLPFEGVGEIVSLEGDDCDFDKRRDQVDDSRKWLIVKGRHMLRCPWNKRISQFLPPSKIIAFEIAPGPGCETAFIGLCSYPPEFDGEYTPEKDARFVKECHLDSVTTSWRFDWKAWKRWLERNGHDTYLLPTDKQFCGVRRAKTKLSGWRWSTFCKTQYASDPRCGGVANFLRCHISLITLLDRIGELPTMHIEIDDEGRYGPANYSDDWREAREQGRKPNYIWHKATYDPKVLAAECGQMNTMIAAMAGAFKDAASKTGALVESPIHDFPDFEHLEFKGSQDQKLQPFLQAMRELAERELRKGESGGK